MVLDGYNISISNQKLEIALLPDRKYPLVSLHRKGSLLRSADHVDLACPGVPGTDPAKDQPPDDDGQDSQRNNQMQMTDLPQEK